MKITMIGSPKDDHYQSMTSTHTLTREGSKHHWVYRIDGAFVESNKYRNDLADKYGLDLCSDIAELSK